MPHTTSDALPTLTEVAPKFLRYSAAEKNLAPRSLIKYQDCLRQIERMIGNRPVDSYTPEDVLDLKCRMQARHHSDSRQISILCAFKLLLAYCQKQRWEVLD